MAPSSTAVGGPFDAALTLGTPGTATSSSPRQASSPATPPAPRLRHSILVPSPWPRMCRSLCLTRFPFSFALAKLLVFRASCGLNESLQNSYVKPRPCKVVGLASGACVCVGSSELDEAMMRSPHDDSGHEVACFSSLLSATRGHRETPAVCDRGGIPHRTAATPGHWSGASSLRDCER